MPKHNHRHNRHVQFSSVLTPQFGDHINFYYDLLELQNFRQTYASKSQPKKTVSGLISDTFVFHVRGEKLNLAVDFFLNLALVLFSTWP